MVAILLEDLLFLTLLGAAFFLVYTLLVRLTPLGRRLAQSRNRRRIDRAAGLYCALHGAHVAEELVRLPDGDLMCPQCYTEAMHDDGA